MMQIEEFTKVSDSTGLKFKDIWSIYDSQFEALRDTILRLSSNLIIEKSTGSTSKVITLSNSYTRNQVMVFKNGSILTKDEYEETDSRTITLKIDRIDSDLIQVVIISSNSSTITYVDTLVYAEGSEYDESSEEVILTNEYKSSVDNNIKVTTLLDLVYDSNSEALTIKVKE